MYGCTQTRVYTCMCIYATHSVTNHYSTRMEFNILTALDNIPKSGS